MRLQRLQLPKTALERSRLGGIGLVHVEWIGHAVFRQLLALELAARLTMDHERARWVRLQHVVDPGHDGDYGRGWGPQRQARKALDEAGDHGGGQVRRGHEGVEQAEEARAVLRVQHFGVEQRVELGVEARVVEVARAHEVEEARQGEQRGGAPALKAVRQKVHEHLDAREPRHDAVGHQPEGCLALALAQAGVEHGGPGFLAQIET